ncbi:MAG: hypothetical protein KIT84_01160 [Labilithrix sp.]|nr:hypothetical protein [Labilithrix sp.]MCW5809594.1 hypothetical protein [Labilithrix sp.]
MAVQNPRAPESAQYDETTRPATATGARRHRPSSKADGESRDAQRKRAKLQRRVTAATTRGAKGDVEANRRGPIAEDRREAPEEMVTKAKPKNLKSADKDDKKSKGKSTRALEATAPGTRPSRKSTRRAANHIKADSQQARATKRGVRSPKSRHAMRAA